jgi:hypothetical protein
LVCGERSLYVDDRKLRLPPVFPEGFEIFVRNLSPHQYVLVQLDEFVNNPSELEDGKHIAYARIGEKAGEFETIPKFLREDSESVQSDPVLAAAVPIMLTTAAQVSVGSRNLVSEDGPDVMNSSDEDSPQEEHGEKLEGMYTSGLKAL